MRLLALVHGGHVNGQVVLLPEPLFTERTGVGPMLLVYRLHVLLEVVLPLEPVRADGTNVGLRAVGLLVNGRLMCLHDVSTEMVPLQEALVAEVTSVRLYLFTKCH